MKIEYKSLAFMGYDRYRVGNDGSVWKYARSRKAWRQLDYPPKFDGYIRVSLYRNGLAKDYAVHRLVLEAFVGPCPKGMEACHFPDRDRSNNSLTNLKWGTKKENCSHKVLQGTSNVGKHYNQGEHHGRAKVSERQVVQIRNMFATRKYTQGGLANLFNVPVGVISGIVKGNTWKHVGGPLTKLKQGMRPKREKCV